jgi:hypothetical protein
MEPRKILLLGCGTAWDVSYAENWEIPRDITRLDMNPEVNPDVLFEIGVEWLPFSGDVFDEIHAYEVLEHVGRQGDWRRFFWEFEDYWRVLKPGGLLVATCPTYNSMWAWGDPGHTRVLTSGTLSFLDQSMYGRPPMTDYRQWYRGNFKAIMVDENLETGQFKFALKAIK